MTIIRNPQNSILITKVPIVMSKGPEAGARVPGPLIPRRPRLVRGTRGSPWPGSRDVARGVLLRPRPGPESKEKERRRLGFFF